MFGAATPYVTALCAMLISAASALILIYTVNHFDSHEVAEEHTDTVGV